MKTLLTAALLTASAAAPAWAGDTLLSPRQKEYRDSITPRPGEEIDRLDRSIKTMSPKTLQFFAELSKRSGTDVDLALRPSLGMSNKHAPHVVFEKTIDVAPLK